MGGEVSGRRGTGGFTVPAVERTGALRIFWGRLEELECVVEERPTEAERDAEGFACSDVLRDHQPNSGIGMGGLALGF